MLYVDYEANSVEAAIEMAIEKLGVSREDITTEVLREGKRGLLGLGQKELAKIRIYYKEKNEIDEVLKDIRGFIAHIDPEAVLTIKQISEQRHDVIIETKNVSHFIGKKGKTLKAIQTLVSSFMQNYKKDHTIIVDIDEYNMKRDGQFAKWAGSQAREVIRTKRAIILKSLNSYERRIIHMEIGKFDQVVSESKGEGKVKNIKLRYVGE